MLAFEHGAGKAAEYEAGGVWGTAAVAVVLLPLVTGKWS